MESLREVRRKKREKRVVGSAEFFQNESILRQRSRLVGENETHAAQRFVERHGVAVHGGARPAGIVEVGVAVDERGVENLDEFERNFEAGGNHRDVEQQEAQREHQREVRNGGLQIPARVAAVQRQSDGGQHEDQKDLRGTRSAARYLQTDDDDGENAGHRIADRDFLLRRVFVLAEFRLVPRVNHRAEAATQRDDAHSRELGELQLRHLQKQVLRGETRVRRSIDAQSARYAARTSRYRASN